MNRNPTWKIKLSYLSSLFLELNHGDRTPKRAHLTSLWSEFVIHLPRSGQNLQDVAILRSHQRLWSQVQKGGWAGAAWGDTSSLCRKCHLTGGTAPESFLIFHNLDTLTDTSWLFCRRSPNMCLSDVFSWLGWCMCGTRIPLKRCVGLRASYQEVHHVAMSDYETCSPLC